MDRGYNYREYKLLFVDDEEMALKYFHKAFSPDFEILTASNADKAWEIIEREGDSIGLVVSDQRMPGQSGVDLLSRIRRERPGIVRILTTAYSELDHAIDAVNSGAVFHYSTKPWQLKELRVVLMRAMEFFLVQRQRDMLLREKLSVLQRMIIMDRVRSFTVIAATLSVRIRNSMSALKMFFDFAPVTVREHTDDATADWCDLWSLAQKESETVLSAVNRVLESAMQDDNALRDQITISDRVARCVERLNHNDRENDDKGQPAIQVIDQSAGRSVRGEARLIDQLLDILLDRAASLARLNGMRDSNGYGGTGDGDGDGQTITLTIDAVESVWNTPGVRVRLTDGRSSWGPHEVSTLFATLGGGGGMDVSSMEGLEMLAAFFIAHHHGGQLLVHTAPPDGPCIELLLPTDPDQVHQPPLEADWLERVFTNLEFWEPQAP